MMSPVLRSQAASGARDSGAFPPKHREKADTAAQTSKAHPKVTQFPRRAYGKPLGAGYWVPAPAFPDLAAHSEGMTNHPQLRWTSGFGPGISRVILLSHRSEGNTCRHLN